LITFPIEFTVLQRMVVKPPAQQVRGQDGGEQNDQAGVRVARSMADRALAAVALTTGSPDTAAQQALDSAAAADDVGTPVDAALSRILAGRALAQAGQRKHAVTELQHAVHDLDACGALRHRAAAEFELRRLGQHIHRRTKPGSPHASGIESLTSRELQIARHIVDRKTNPEIAAALFLSPKTVETHIRTLFNKLDVSSRVEVARAVEKSDTSKKSS
jgi:DNA-binding NarL/FixJ family response regulator